MRTVSEVERGCVLRHVLLSSNKTLQINLCFSPAYRSQAVITEDSQGRGKLRLAAGGRTKLGMLGQEQVSKASTHPVPSSNSRFSASPHPMLAGWPGEYSQPGARLAGLLVPQGRLPEPRLPRPSLCLCAEGSMTLWKPLLSLERGTQLPPHRAREKCSA